jgi:hypothetical protein
VPDEPANDIWVADDDAKLEIERECLVGEVGAAEQRDAFISGDRLGVQCGSRVADGRAPGGGPRPEGGVLPDGLERGGCPNRPMQNSTLVVSTLEDQIDPHSASRSQPEFVNHLRDAERGETNDQ